MRTDSSGEPFGCADFSSTAFPSMTWPVVSDTPAAGCQQPETVNRVQKFLTTLPPPPFSLEGYLLLLPPPPHVVGLG